MAQNKLGSDRAARGNEMEVAYNLRRQAEIFLFEPTVIH
jgi:hypothetical protein